MDRNERLLIITLLVMVAGMATVDILTDIKGALTLRHILLEGGAGVTALFGIFYFMRGTAVLKEKLTASVKETLTLKQDAKIWKIQAQKHIEGLAQSINAQLHAWNLSQAEKEIALLLLKGFR